MEQTTTPVVEATKPFGVSLADKFAEAIEKGASAVLSPEQSKPQEAPKPEAKPVQEDPKEEAKPDVQVAEKKKSRFFEVKDEPSTDPAKPDAKLDAAQEAKEPEKPVAPVQAEPDNAPIKQLRDNYKRVKEELERLKAERESVVDTSELDRLKGELDEREKLISRLRYEESKEYREKYVAPAQNALERIKKSLPTEKHDAFMALAVQPPSGARTAAIEQLLEGESTLRQLEIARLLGQHDDIQEERGRALSQARDRAQAVMREEHQRFSKQSEKVFGEVLNEAMEELPIFNVNDGDANQQREVQAMVAEAKKLFSGDNDMHTVAAASLLAVAAKRAIPLLAQMEKLVAQKDAEIARLRNVEPKAPAVQPPQDRKPATVFDAVAAAMGIQD